jgi:hypothetical protein
MNREFRQNIYNELNLRETEDLLEIWQENDRLEWSEDVFVVIREILNARGVELPQQEEAKYEHDESEDYEFTEEELRIVDDENPPDFYDPLEVLKVSKWINLALKAMIGLIVIQNLLNLSTFWRIAQSYFVGSKYIAGAYPLTLMLVAVNIGITILLTYIPLKLLSPILRILMEMEFKSRKAS